jgi:hypothetical protein
VELWAGGAGIVKLDAIVGVRLLQTLDCGRDALAELRV